MGFFRRPLAEPLLISRLVGTILFHKLLLARVQLCDPNSFGLGRPSLTYGSVDGNWSFVIPFSLRGCRNHLNCAGRGGSFGGHCLLPRLESPAGRAFVNGMTLIATLDAPVLPFPFVLDFLRNFDKGRRLLRPRVIVGIAAA